ncbi:unnamed protein product [marine sediment metagenome]|uniref:Uncharacterized protein n=1 Tax=marine sediment metagenome TaxID=412755 RepID=X1CBD0_9ZZZZ
MLKAQYVETLKGKRYFWRVLRVTKKKMVEEARSHRTWASRHGAERGLKTFVGNVFSDVLGKL